MSRFVRPVEDVMSIFAPLNYENAYLSEHLHPVDSMKKNSFFAYVGKSQKKDDGDREFHLLPFHLLDAAAVSGIFLEQRPDITNTFRRKLGFENSDDFINFFRFFTALHDLGKFSKCFQDMIEGKKPGKYIRHDQLGINYYQKTLSKTLSTEIGFKKPKIWAGVSIAHHGKFLQTEKIALERFFEPYDDEAIEEWVLFLKDFFWSKMSADLDFLKHKSFKSDSKVLSWWAAGIIVLSDWIASGSRHFHHQDKEENLKEYWEKTQARARKALEEFGLHLSKSASAKNFSYFFPSYDPTPLQSEIDKVEIHKGANLFILEDVTGSGKTEAAFYLAHRLMSEEAVNGFYLALPTKATSNAMFARMKDLYRKLFDENDKPSLILAHGSRKMNELFRELLNSYDKLDDEEDQEGFAGYCNSWLADNPKKALLAEIGVGTLDQALLSVLPAKHQSLRLLGLFGKLLIVDEVHSYDAYANKLLERLIAFHSSVGGSVILMSATIPKNLKLKFVGAFNDALNLGSDRETMRKELGEEFPLLTSVHAGDGRIKTKKLDTREEVKRKVQVEMISEEKEIHKLIEESLSEGKCVCWIRNTVGDAQEAFKCLSERIPALNKSEHPVFHSRFALGDRLDIEEKILSSFDKNSAGEVRRDKLLIATQVVEQSLDLDFDVLISDLAPIDAIIQRAGRLQRHVRDSDGNPVSDRSAKDARQPIFYIFGPSPDENPPVDWFTGFFEKGKYVYENDVQLWLTANELKKKGGWTMPEDARYLIENVYGDDVEEPENLIDRTLKAEGKDISARDIANKYCLKLRQGYGGSHEWDDPTILTRLSMETTTLLLGEWNGSKLSPLYEKYERASDHETQSEKDRLRAPWQYSSLQLPATTLPAGFDLDNEMDEELPLEIKVVESLFYGRKKVLPLVEDNGVWKAAIWKDDRKMTFVYDAKFGLRKEDENPKKKNVMKTTSDDPEC